MQLDAADVFARARSISDVLSTLLDDAPASRHEAIHFLVDRCEALMKGVTN